MTKIAKAIGRSVEEWIGGKGSGKGRGMSRYVKKIGAGGRRDNGTPIDTQFFLDRSTLDAATGCWNWLKATSNLHGYGVLRVEGRTVRAHRMAFLVANGFIPPSDRDICHSCDNRRCVNAEHLFEGSRKDNMADCAAKGRIKVPLLRGDDCPNSKLSSDQVLKIREDARSQRELGRVYGVDRGTIASIQSRKTWRHL